MNNPLLLSLGTFLDVAPYAFLCYFPFRDKLKLSGKKLLALLSVPAITEFLIFYFYQPITYQFVQCIFFLFLTIYFLIYLATVRVTFPKLFYIFLLNTDYGGIMILISNYLEISFFPNHTHIGGYSLTVFTLVASVIAIPLGVNVIHKKATALLSLENTKAWGSLWVVPLMFFLILVSMACVDNDAWVRSWPYIIMTVTMAVGGCVVLYMVSKMLIETDKNATLREDVRMFKMQLVFQKSAYEKLSSRITEIKAARHDLRHHLSVIETYLQLKKYDDLQRYLDEYKSSLPDNREFFLCENSAANVIVLHYVEAAANEGIFVKTSLHLPQKIKISDMDLCIVLGNCIENALEACRRMESGPKYIHVKSKIHGDILGIVVDNSFDGKVEVRNGKFLSRKRNNEEGLGIASVRAIAAKYRGTALCRYDEKEFRVSVMLNLREDL
ncbi:MAG: GHKL domain-containing protein [Intestinimonas sp.]|jgi:hypothetical protein|nr:GHKL domain-containing protein [Intestinimonas sp.]